MDELITLPQTSGEHLDKFVMTAVRTFSNPMHVEYHLRNDVTNHVSSLSSGEWSAGTMKLRDFLTKLQDSSPGVYWKSSGGNVNIALKDEGLEFVDALQCRVAEDASFEVDERGFLGWLIAKFPSYFYSIRNYGPSSRVKRKYEFEKGVTLREVLNEFASQNHYYWTLTLNYKEVNPEEYVTTPLTEKKNIPVIYQVSGRWGLVRRK